MTEQLTHTLLLLVVIAIIIFGVILLLDGVFSKIEYTTQLDIHEEPDEEIVKTDNKMIILGIIIILIGYILGCIYKL